MAKLNHSMMDEFFFQEMIKDERVLKGPEYGEDASVLKIGDEYLIAHPDPISGAVKNIGWLSIHVPANDIAVTGGRPRWALSSIQMPEDMEKEALVQMIDDMKGAAERLNVTLVGGHTEKIGGIDRPLITTTMLGTTERIEDEPKEPVYTSGAEAGDKIVQIKEAGIEGTWVLASDFGEELLEKGAAPDSIEKARGWRERISVVEPALKVRDSVNSMHDPTEGGVIQGLYEMCNAAAVDFEVNEEISVADETKDICRTLGLDPLRLISSGCLLATCPGDKSLSIKHETIGRVKEGSGRLILDGEEVQESVEDELFRAIRFLR